MSKHQDFELNSKRADLNVFVNQYVTCISKSVIACNTNARIMTGKHEGFYSTKYASKKT